MAIEKTTAFESVCYEGDFLGRLVVRGGVREVEKQGKEDVLVGVCGEGVGDDAGVVVWGNGGGDGRREEGEVGF